MSNLTPIPIAIIGMSCRFPGGANNPEQLWDMLAEGRSGWTDVPADRYNWKSFYHPNPEARGAHNSRGGHFIDQDISEFDPLFFGITPQEADSLDPQQRLQLMSAYEALENAGIPIESIRGSDTSVHIAVVSRDYDRMAYKDPSDIPKYHLTGCGDATACGRISYTFDFHGPSVTIDTGCSGSMVALHQACQGLRLGEASMALVGGTNLLLGPDMTIAMSMLHMLNDDGRCYSFDSRGSGYGRSEGVATIVLKRLDDALLAKDPIRAIIRNTGINQDGKTNGILLPSSESQQALVRSMYDAIEIDPCTVAYVEAHGTGTAAGDYAEINSISKVFCDDNRREKPVYVGSIKANIGHLESASGLAGIIKTVMAMEKCLIPPVPNIIVLKKNINLEKYNIKIPQELQQWPGDGVQHASINSFGFGGTNAHVILESGPREDYERKSGLQNGDHKADKVNGVNGTHSINGTYQSNSGQNTYIVGEDPILFVLSAKSKQSLARMANNLKLWLSSHSVNGNLLPDLSYTLANRRSKMAWRSSFVASSAVELIQGLASPQSTKAASTSQTAFVFTGQGAQWFAMGRELLATNYTFKNSLAQSEQILASLGASWNLLEELCRDKRSTRINESQISQPATIAVQIGLVDLMKSLSVLPHAVLGHSSGEVAAAYAAGILSQESALKVAYQRGFASNWYAQISEVKGAMIAVGLGEKDTQSYISRIQLGTCSIACQNSPISTTVSGDEHAIDQLKNLLDSDAVFNRKLKIDTAYHSHHMKIIAKHYLNSLQGLRYNDPLPSVKFFSSVTGKEKSSNFGDSYWVENLISTVRFSDALQRLVCSNSTNVSHVVIELGPHSALQGPIRQLVTHLNIDSLKYLYLPSLVRDQDARRSILNLFGKLFEQGCAVDLALAVSLFLGESSPARVVKNLPPYTWDLTKHWHESRLSREYRFRSQPYHDLLGLRVIGSTSLEPNWRNILSVDDLPWLHEHIIDNFALFPGSGFLCMAIEAMAQIAKERATTANKSISKFTLKEISFSKALIIPDSPQKVEVMLSLRSLNPVEKGALSWELFRITSLGQDGIWNEHCQGSIAIEFALPANAENGNCLEDELSAKEAVEYMEMMKRKCTSTIDNVALYQELRKNGVDYGKTFSTIQKLQIGRCQAVGEVMIPDVAACMPSGYLQPHIIHPATFDALMHIALPLYSRNCTRGPAMLIAIDEVTVFADILKAAGDELTVACDLSPTGPLSGVVNVSVFQRDTKPTKRQVLTISGQTFRGIGESRTGNSNADLAQNMSFQVDLCDFEESKTVEDIQHPVNIIYSSKSKYQEKLAYELSAGLSSKGVEESVSAGFPDQIDQHTIYLILEDPKMPIMVHKSLQNKVLHANAKFVMIVSSAPNQNTPLISSQSPITESIEAQRQTKLERLVTFRLDGAVNDELHASDSIIKALFHSFSQPENGKAFERDYNYTGNQLTVPRLTEATELSKWLTGISGKQTIEEGLLYQKGRPLKLEVRTPGLLDSLVFVDDDSAQTVLRSDELEIEVHAHSVNQKDVIIAMGRLSYQTPMVGEFSGIVIAAGLDALSRFKIGDRVCGWGGLPYRTNSRINWRLAHHLPDSFSFAQGASIPYAFQTVYHALVDIANIQRGDSILIHSVLSGVGIAAAMIAHHLGAEIFVTISNESASKRDILVNQLKIPVSHIFSNNSDVFRKGILRITGGKGVNAVLNSLSRMVSDTWACVAEFGTIVDISKSKEPLPLRNRDGNITFASIDMVSLAKGRPGTIQSLFEKVMLLFSDGSLKPTHPLIEMSMSDIVLAFRLVQLRKHTGKVILTAEKDTKVRQITFNPAKLFLKDNGVYIVAGGEFDLVKSICNFLAEHGAKQIILLSASTSNVNNQILHETLSIGLNLEVHTCSIQGDQAAKIASSLTNRGATVRGIIQCEFLQLFNLGVFESESLEFLIHISPVSSTSLPDRIVPFSHDNGSLRRRNMISLSLGSLSTEEFFLILEYAISSQAKLDKYKHLIIGLDQKSMGAHSCITDDPFFSHLKVKNEDFGRSDNEKKPNEIIDHSMTHQEAEEHTHRAVIKKLATLVAVDEDDIKPESPFSEIGLDSLAAIEFKNWIGRALSAPMQTSEILDSLSIRALTALIVKRSALIANQITPALGGANGFDRDLINASSGVAPMPKLNGAESLSPPKPKLPRLPLPDMESTLQFYLNSVRAFCSDQEFARTCDAVNKFQEPGGVGRELHARLDKLANDPTIDCWFEDFYNNSNFLSRRVQLIPFSSFFFTHKLSPFQHSQSERAAIIAESAFKYQQLLESDQLPDQYLNEQPVCTFLNKWLFNAARRPGIRLDTMHKFPGNEYLVTLSRGRIFKVPLREGSSNVSYRKLKATFDAILQETRGSSPVSWTGILTADERNSWTKFRGQLREINTSNALSIDVVEASSFIICLDEALPATAAERARHYHFGDGLNRWNDKSLQFPVCSNGISGIVGDHSMIDAGTVFGLNAFVTKAIIEHKGDDEIELTNGTPAVMLQEFPLTTDKLIDLQIKSVQKEFVKATSGVEHDFFTTEGFGGVAMRSIKCAPKSAFQVIAMLASKEFFSRLEPCWETASLSNFYKGRVEINQALLPPVAKFLELVDDESLPRESRRKLFFDAVKAHASSVTRATRGRGCDRYFSSLRQVIQEEEWPVELFKDPTYGRTRPRKFMSHSHETGMLEQGFLLRDPEAIWLHYVVEDMSVKWSICGTTGRTKIFHALLDKSARKVQALLGIETKIL